MRFDVGKRSIVAPRAPDNLEIEQVRDATAEDIQIMSIFQDPRQPQDSDAEGVEKAEEVIQCPDIDVIIENIGIRRLVDTGSPITCISEEFHMENIKILGSCPRLPIIGQIIKGAIGTKSARLKVQLMAEILVGQGKEILFI